MVRGALIVLEGLDRAGKSTQVNLLVDALKKRSIETKKGNFPNRTSPATGKILNDFLAKKVDLNAETAHLLFSANRWECEPNIHDDLIKGTTLIVDRYAASGAAFSAVTTKRSLSWCKAPDCGLPAPDLVIFLEINGEAQSSRANWGEERFENKELQCKVAENFRKLADNSWVFVEANRPIDVVHEDILQKTLLVIETCKNKPVRTLYETEIAEY